MLYLFLRFSYQTRLGWFYVTAILSSGYGWGWVEAEVDYTWDWSEIEMRLSGSLVEIELRLSWVGVETSWH